MRIFTQQELIPYLSHADQLEGRFNEKDFSISEGADFLVDNLQEHNYYFGAVEKGVIQYLTIILREMWLYTPSEAYIWMHHVHKNNRELSKIVLGQVSDFLKKEGIKKVIIDACKSSFIRWVEKQGFYKKTIIYEKEL
jgi:hypothetical protein